MKWAACVMIVLAMLVAGCSGGKAAGGAAANDNVLRYPIPELTKLDPAMVQDGDTIDVIQQVFEGLVGWSTDSKVEPRLAESWTVSKDGTVYTFKLRKNVKFSNGRVLTADDFKYSIERAADPKLKSPTTQTYLGAILGVNDKLAGHATEVKGVKVIDPSTLQITIDKPRPYFLGDLTYPASWAVCKEALKDGAEIEDVATMVGTGPFKAASFIPNEKISLVANKDYWNGAPKLAGIERPIVKDANTRLNLFRTHQVDLTRVERADTVGIKNDASLSGSLKFFDRPALYYVGLNCTTYKPFTDRRVRQAFAMAIDSDEIVKDTLDGEEAVAHCILPPSVLGHRDNADYIKFNVAQAKQLLAAAGFADGHNMPPLTLNCRDGQSDVKAVAERVVTLLRQNLGVEATVQTLPWTNYLDVHTQNKLDFFHMRWSADYLDPQNFLSTLLTTHGAEEHNNYSNPQVDALCDQADVMVNDDAKRLGLYAKAEDLVLQDAPFIPVYFERDAELISPRVKGLRESVFGHLPHTTTTLE